MYSLAALYGVSAFTQRMNWSSAIRAIGVRSRQLNGMPVWRGVVKRLESVMIRVWASPFFPLTSRKPSAPAPPDLLTTMSGRGESLCFSAMPEIRRAIWSAPPPVPAGTTNSIGFVGSQAAPAGAAAISMRTSARAVLRAMATPFDVRGYKVGFDRKRNGPDPVRGPALALRDDGPSDHARHPVGYLTSRAALVASRRRKGTTAGISHFSHISSTFFWKYSRSSSVKCAKRPCFKRYSRTGLRSRPSTIALVLP